MAVVLNAVRGCNIVIKVLFRLRNEKRHQHVSLVCKLYFISLQKFLNTIHNKFKAILAIFFLLSLKQEQNTSYISDKKHYTLFIYEQNAFLYKCTSVGEIL